MHFTGIEQSMGIQALFKGKLARIDGFTASSFQVMGVGVEDDGSLGFVIVHDGVEAIVALVAHQL